MPARKSNYEYNPAKQATASLAQFVDELGDEPVILTAKGKPVAALVSLKKIDPETFSLSLNPQFMEIINRSRASVAAKGVLSEMEVRRRLGLPARRAKKLRPARAK